MGALLCGRVGAVVVAAALFGALATPLPAAAETAGSSGDAGAAESGDTGDARRDEGDAGEAGAPDDGAGPGDGADAGAAATAPDVDALEAQLTQAVSAWETARDAAERAQAARDALDAALAEAQARQDQAADTADAETAALVARELDVEAAGEALQAAEVATAEALEAHRGAVRAYEQALVRSHQRREELGEAAAAAYASGDPGVRAVSGLVHALDQASNVTDFLTATERLKYVTREARGKLDTADDELAASADAAFAATAALSDRRQEQHAATEALADAEAAAQAQREHRDAALTALDEALEAVAQVAAELADADAEVTRANEALADADAEVAQASAALAEAEGALAAAFPSRTHLVDDLPVATGGSGSSAAVTVGGTGWRAGALGRGGLVWPVDGRPGSGFGPRVHPIHGGVRPHLGVDVGAPTGRPVVAAAGGQIVHAGPRGGYGITVIIDHGGGRSTLYAHLSAVTVQRGQQVQQAALIGRVGSTGQSTGPHLHFEVRDNGRPRDPLHFFR